MVDSIGPPDVIEAVKSNIPLGKFAQLKQISNLVLFLASDDSNYSTRFEFIIDGSINTSS